MIYSSISEAHRRSTQALTSISVVQWVRFTYLNEKEEICALHFRYANSSLPT